MQDDPYGQIFHQDRQLQTQSSAQKGGNLSEQKTPSAHPNTFLYRAHINMNELSSTQQEEYHHNDQIQHQMNQGNVSSFYNDDIDELEERKDGLRI